MSSKETFSVPFRFSEAVDYSEDTVLSKTILKKSSGTVTLFSFDKGEGLSEHSTPFDALVQIIDGEAEITLSGQAFSVIAGYSIILPANLPHALKAIKRFKMLLTMLKS